MKTVLLFLLLTTILHAGVYHPAIDYIFPLPDSKLVSIHTIIFLKLDESLNSRISYLSNLITVKGEDGIYSGQVFFAADGRTIIFKPNEPLQTDEFLTVSVQKSQVADKDFIYDFQTVHAEMNDLDGLPLHKELYPHQSEISMTISPPRIMNRVAVPSDFPTITTRQYGETAPGRIFLHQAV